MPDQITLLRPEGLVQIRAWGRCCYLLARRRSAVLIDTGGPRHARMLHDALLLNSLEREEVGALLLTQGSVWNAGNARRLQATCGARLHINRLDEPRLHLRYPESRRHRARALVEQVLVRRHGYEAPDVDIFVGDGDVLDLWYGLRVVHLPGPTPGHCGYYCRHLNVLFSGSLPIVPASVPVLERASFSDREAAEESTVTALAMNADLICGSHGAWTRREVAAQRAMRL